MIIVKGTKLDPAELKNAYADKSVQMQLLSKMSESMSSYQYDNLGRLEFELTLRNEIVNASYALNKSRLNFAGFHDTRCNDEYWQRTANGGFSLKAGANPAKAINDIYESGEKYATECATAMMIVYYKALVEVFGEARFNKIFSKIYLMNWEVREPLLKGVGSPKKASDILLGDRGYFANPDVNPQTPQWQGENVIVLPNYLYYGHGIGLTSADKIIKALNSNRKRGAANSAYFMDAVGRPDFKALSKIYDSKAEEAAAVSDMSTLVWKPFPKPLRG